MVCVCEMGVLFVCVCVSVSVNLCGIVRGAGNKSDLVTDENYFHSRLVNRKISSSQMGLMGLKLVKGKHLIKAH